ncbi:GNAT family N-acetyltransferase [Bacteroides cellulosilyticus]|jgi:hypothetical protein|uniref:Acetyltransferase, GNAT family n=1 Tax=Bacteroides cellulosilyticus DSM 14838 TaxID=537012 RepID=E2NIN6_9BACE|nr:GNAT family N-acetyltransferase [Bacteroides cellulosilyticus]EEF88221.1 acetyltransferase, GNAT family [Bacteroides cellulosilyticus DSM 14838]MBN9709478.1 GNAT family N-acetyltransferase [Bacteroides cellulosilyticus]MDC7307421.1 GNAT family N-acetyltransferase [Bacteroides cellulosilyticus DSM 14838]
MEISIRPLRVEDAYTSVKWRNDPEVFKYTGNTYNREITIQDELLWVKKVIQDEDGYRCAILADNQYVGNIYLTNICNDSAVYHIFLGERSVWGKGVAKQASRLILRYAFDSLDLNLVELRVKMKNERAIELYKRIGFQEHSRDEEWIHMTITKDSM